MEANDTYSGSPPNDNNAIAPPNVESEAPYTTEKQIGKGSFAVVYKGHLRSNNSTVAIKVVQRNKLNHNKKLLGIFESELEILTSYKHPNVVGLLDVYRTEEEYSLIMEYCCYGDLSGFIKDRHNLVRGFPELSRLFAEYHTMHNGLHEYLVRHLVGQLASALDYLRSHNIVHRDIKPHNLLLMPNNLDSPGRLSQYSDFPVLKLADFGFARFLPAASMAETLCGSPLYMAPEILRYEKYNASADIWSLGAVTFEACTGRPPFPAANHIDLLRKIEAGQDNIVFPSNASNLSEEMKDLIQGLLKQIPKDRLSFDEIITHPALLLPLRDSNEQINSFDLTASSTRSHLGMRQNDDNLPETPGLQLSSSLSDSSCSASLEPPSLSRRSYDGPATPSAITRQSDSLTSTEYVVVEKRTVEVNVAADEMKIVSGMPMAGPVRRPSRRLSSINYGFSPTNALASALSKSSARLFGLRHASGTDLNLSESVAIDSMRMQRGRAQSVSKSELQIFGILETFSSMARAVETIADGMGPSLVQESDLDSAQVKQNSEALMLYMKALNLYAKAMKHANTWWKARKSGDSTIISAHLSAKVEAIRNAFNKSIGKAEKLRLISCSSRELSNCNEQISADRILFDRALYLSRVAAVQELSADTLKESQAKYTTAVWLLKAILDRDQSEPEFTESGKILVEKLCCKITVRLGNLNLRVNSATESRSRQISHSPSPRISSRASS